MPHPRCTLLYRADPCLESLRWRSDSRGAETERLSTATSHTGAEWAVNRPSEFCEWLARLLSIPGEQDLDESRLQHGVRRTSRQSGLTGSARHGPGHFGQEEGRGDH
jgi:hypothetical protein